MTGPTMLPIKITNVWFVDSFGKEKLASFYPSFMVQPFVYDDLTEDGLVVAGFEDTYFDIYVAQVEPTRRDLVSTVHAELRFLIREYYYADDSTLSPEAIKLKNKLRARITIRDL